MDLLSALQLGMSTALAPQNLVYSFLGVILGQIVGVLPGLGAMTAISLLLPVTYYLDPTQSMIMLAGIYYGSQYGGSIASILLSIPGTPSSVITCLEGYPMARKGRAGAALFLASTASLFGSIVGVTLLVAAALPLSQFAVEFGATEYFSLVLMGLIGASVISNGSALRALAMMVLGILFGLVGSDVNTGAYRFVITPEFADGISLIAVAMGMFGVAEILNSVGSARKERITQVIEWSDLLPKRDEVRGFAGAASRGSALGAAFGALPGTGAAIASFVAYAAEKRISRTPEKFGTGEPAGLVAPEASNNAASITGFIPTLALGIPGDAVMALMLGGLIINGIVPGPGVVTEHPALFWGVIASFIVGNVILVMINLPLIKLWVRFLSIPYWALFPGIIVCVCIGVYSFRNSVVDVFTTLFFAAVGLLLSRSGYPAPPLLLGFILGPKMEEYLRRSMLLHDGDLTVFFTRPLSAFFMFGAIALLVLPALSRITANLRKSQRGSGSA